MYFEGVIMHLPFSGIFNPFLSYGPFNLFKIVKIAMFSDMLHYPRIGLPK